MITVENLCKTYGSGEGAVNALRNADLTIKDGELVAIVGKSGSGKSTLLNLLGGLDSATSGKVIYNDVDIMKMNEASLADFRLRKIGFVFQFYDLLPELTTEENILLPAQLAKNKSADISALAERLGLTDRLKHYPSQLSGGQQQRAAIARALINNPDVLLCDEPTGNLDQKTGDDVMELLLQLNKTEKRTIVIVTHNPEIAARCERTIEISDGTLIS
ncbi:MAG: ABC transporter ATP-binding protein [Oscillospiraceae bacterium]|nr:ABC transporter ATP-binding protein [Oscillospiraceae bacterium]